MNETKESFRRTDTVFAEQENKFEIEVVDENGIPQDEVKRLDLLNMKANDMVNWTVSDEDKETVLFSKDCSITEKVSSIIPKKLSGEYYYALQASVAGRKDQIDELRIKGYCEPKVLKTSIESDAEGDLCFGHIITVLSEAEGVNGNNIKVEIFNEKEICVANLDTKCHEGDIRREGFDTLGWHSKCKEPGCQEEPEEYLFRVRIKDRQEYMKDAVGNLDVFEFTIKNKDDKPATTVDNKMIAIINADQTNLSPEPEQVGVLALESAWVEADYIVTNDKVHSIEKDYWILKDGNGNDSHWVKSEYREIVTDENIKDEKNARRKTIKEIIKNNKYKPWILPVMLPGMESFCFTAWFKVIIPFEKASIRITDINKRKDKNEKEIKYTFDNMNKTGGEKDELFPLTFISQMNPYKDQVQYFDKFQLLVEYSVDDSSWIHMDIICFELYLTWQEPINLPNIIPETLLRYACEYASNCTEEEEIVEKVFVSFNQKEKDGVPRIYRVRDGEKRPEGNTFYLDENLRDRSNRKETGIGYWRDSSEKGTGFDTGATGQIESAMFLLNEGTGRCGEWKDLFITVLWIHGIDSCEKIAICTDLGIYYGLDYDKPSPTKNTNYGSVEFAVKNALIISYDFNTKTYGIHGTSFGQGNSKAQPTFLDHTWCYYCSENSGVKKFYDPSYAIDSEATINDYCIKSLSNIHTYRIGVSQSDEFKDINIHDYIYANKPLFK